jgi:hypothetical protein
MTPVYIPRLGGSIRFPSRNAASSAGGVFGVGNMHRDSGALGGGWGGLD